MWIDNLRSDYIEAFGRAERERETTEVGTKLRVSINPFAGRYRNSGSQNEATPGFGTHMRDELALVLTDVTNVSNLRHLLAPLVDYVE